MLQALTTPHVLERINAFDGRYVNHCRDWMRVTEGCDFQSVPITIAIAKTFRRIMHKWIACGLYKALRGPTEILCTLHSATEPLRVMGPSVDLRSFEAPGKPLADAMCSLWQIFQDGLCAQGKATEVGITKAILLVTKGRIGPAFDSNVKTELKAWYVSDCKSYLKALANVAGELAAFEAREGSLEELAAKAGRRAAVGRVVDMVFGPR